MSSVTNSRCLHINIDHHEIFHDFVESEIIVSFVGKESYVLKLDFLNFLLFTSAFLTARLQSFIYPVYAILLEEYFICARGRQIFRLTV